MNKMLIGVIRAQLRFTVDNNYGFHKTFVVTKSIIPEFCNNEMHKWG